MRALLTIFALSFFFSVSAHASYLVVPYNREVLDKTVRTHFVITSRGGSLGMTPQLSALTRAAKLKEVYPADQVVLLLHDETSGNLDWIKKRVSNAAYRVQAKFDPQHLFDELEPYTSIVSIHTYGHGAIPEGVFLGAVGEHDIRWYVTDKNPKRIIGHFTPDAFVTLNGCNDGHAMASRLSYLWKLPVSGALTGTHFEVLMPDGRFSMMTDEKNWAKSHMGLFADGSECVRGCVRMRPDNAPYTAGHYGTYRQGLGFYKFFCVGISENDCLRGMARSLISTVTVPGLSAKPTFEQYAQAAREWLCPTGSRAVQMACEQRLTAVQTTLAMGLQLSDVERIYTPFSGPSHQCDFIGCYANRECLKSTKTLACAEQSAPPPTSSTFVDEYMNYLKGYRLLK